MDSKDKLGTLLKACGKGSQVACSIAKKFRAVYAGSVITFSDAKIDPKHPNKLPFSGTLLIVDEASQKPPHGSEGHRIFVAKDVAKSKLSGIIGMAVNYSSDLSQHASRNKVGVVTKAWLEGNQVKVSGFIWDKDFPEAQRLKGRNDLGMSMELANVYVDDEDSSVWKLNDFEFTGATILRKDAAAYTKTTLAAKAAATSVEGEGMKKPKEKEKTKVAAANRDTGQSGETSLAIQAMAGTITQALQSTVGPLVNEIKASNQNLRDDLAEIGGRLQVLEMHAAADDEDDEVEVNAAYDSSDEEDDEDMTAAKEDDEASDDSDEEDMTAAKEDDDEEDDSSDDDGSVDAMEDLGKEDASQEPGEVNKDAKSKGDKTSVSNPPKQKEHFSGNVAKGRIHSAGGKGKGMKPFGKGMDAAAVQIQTLYASNKRLKKTMKAMADDMTAMKKKYRTQIRTVNAQLEAFTASESRRSHMPVELVNLAAKSGVNLAEIKANGQKLSVTSVDELFANAQAQGMFIEPKDRIGMKNLMAEHGLLEDGAIDRGYGRAN